MSVCRVWAGKVPERRLNVVIVNSRNLKAREMGTLSNSKQNLALQLLTDTKHSPFSKRLCSANTWATACVSYTFCISPHSVFGKDHVAEKSAMPNAFYNRDDGDNNNINILSRALLITHSMDCRCEMTWNAPSIFSAFLKHYRPPDRVIHWALHVPAAHNSLLGIVHETR